MGVMNVYLPTSPVDLRGYGQRCSLVGIADKVVGEYVVGASHGQPYTELVVSENIVGHGGIENLHQRNPSVAVVVDVVSF